MTSSDHSSESTSPMQSPLGVDMKLEVVTLPVADVDRAKSFYQSWDGDWTVISTSATTSERSS
jgi:hypothetical protein